MLTSFNKLKPYIIILMLKLKRKPKVVIGLLPIQNSCSFLLYSVRNAATLDLFPSKDLENRITNSTNKIKKYLDCKIEQIQEEAINVRSVSCACAPIHLFGSVIEKQLLDTKEIQSLFTDIISEALEHFFYQPEHRWAKIDFDVARGEVQAAQTIVSALLPCYQNTPIHSQLHKLAQKLLLAEVSLNSTTYDEQLALAEYDLAVSQHKINASMRTIAICSIIVAIIALIFAVLNFLPSATNVFNSLYNLLH